MKYLILLFLASVSHAGPADLLSTPGTKTEGYQQDLQQTLDGMFSTLGGTVTGNIYITSGSLVLNYGNSIVFPDGTSQNTASVSATYASTQSVNYIGTLDKTFSNTAANTSVSTLTITASGSWHICTSGTTYLKNDGLGNLTGITLAINGFPISNFSNTTSPWIAYALVASREIQVSTVWRSSNTWPSGSVSAALEPWVSGGNGSIGSGTQVQFSKGDSWWFYECP